jgi:signal transduction histidine kinase/CheY-like chemotaxis protein
LGLVGRSGWQERLLSLWRWPILLSAAMLLVFAPQTAARIMIFVTFGTIVAIAAALVDRQRAAGTPARIYILAWGGVIFCGVYSALATLGILGSLGSAIVAFKTSLVVERGLSSLGLAEVIRRLKARGKVLADAALTEAEERGRAELALEEREEQLRQAKRLEMVGQLAGGVAHDFNNLLQVIRGYTDLMLERAAEGSPERSELDEIKNAAEQATTLTRQLLAFSRRQVLQPVDVDLSELVRDLQRLLERVLPEHIELHLTYASPAPIVHTDVRQMEQVVINLCVNARDAMPRGGTIEIETRLLEASDPGLAGKAWAERERYGELVVRDSGEGIPPDVIDHIFEPFFTTKEEGQGTGLGLSTVYGVVHQHGGQVEIETEPGRGTAFHIYLPVVGGPAQRLEREAAPHARGGSGELVLIAEDDERVRFLTERILRQAGYMTISASDGEEALQRFEEQADEIAAVVLDVIMPRLGGVEIHETIRSRRPDVPVIFCSGYTANLLEDELLLNPDTNFLRKPYTASELLATLQAAVGRKPRSLD